MRHICVLKKLNQQLINIQKQNAPGSDEFTGEFYQVLQKKLYKFFTISFRR